jgi:hypothetical protein
MTKQGIRNKKGERWTAAFTAFEESDRNDRTKYALMPSPKGDNWFDYVKHRLTCLKKGMAAYTTARYTRLRFDKYIEANRISDRIAALIVRNFKFF